MNTSRLTYLITEANEHSARAADALEAGQLQAAQDEMAKLATEYEAFCAESTDEAPNEQKDDAEDHKSTDEKGCVGDVPHIGHNVPS